MPTKVFLTLAALLAVTRAAVDTSRKLGVADKKEKIEVQTIQCNGKPCVTGRVIVSYKRTKDTLLAKSAVPTKDPLGISKVRSLDGSKGNTALYKIEANEDPVAVSKRLSQRKDVRWAEPDMILNTVATPNDVKYTSQYGFAKINAPAAWEKFTLKDDVTVGVIDTGIDATHPDLADRINGTYCYNGGQSDCSPDDINGHGTHTAGTVGAATNNEVGVAGTAWGVKVASCSFLNSDGWGSTSDAVLCIKKMQAEGLMITSNSWGGYYKSRALEDAIDAVCKDGGLFVAAAGNNKRNIDWYRFYPASFDLPCILSVASSDRYDQRSSFSNYGMRNVDVAAPGTSILSTWVTTGPNALKDSYRTISGTSMATPHVAGAAAMVYGASGKTANAQDIKSIIIETADKLKSFSRKSVSEGRLNLNAAIDRALLMAPQPEPVDSQP